jgi:hypothetical protein
MSFFLLHILLIALFFMPFPFGIGNARQGWELPGCGQPALCWRTGQHGTRLASVSAGKLDKGR